MATPAVNGAVGGYDASRNIGKPTPQTFGGRIIKDIDGKFKLKGLGNKLTVLDVGVSGARIYNSESVDPRFGEAMRKATSEDERNDIRSKRSIGGCTKKDDIVVGMAGGSACTVGAFLCGMGASYLHNEFTNDATDRAIADSYFNNIVPQYNVPGYVQARDDRLRREGIKRNDETFNGLGDDFFTP